MNTQDKNHYLQLIEKEPNAWALARYLKQNPTVIDDQELASVFLAQDGTLIRYCSGEIKNDYDLALVAVTNNGMALDYLSAQLKDNDDIVKIAMKLNQAVCFASDRIKNDKDFALMSLTQNPSDIRFYSQEIRDICGTASTYQQRILQREKLKKAIESETLAFELDTRLDNKATHTKIKI